jgi:Domain of unknown function (DUF4263)
MNYREIITRYLSIVDESLDELSMHNEGKISNLPSWVFHKRKIDIGITNDNEGVVIKIAPDGSLEEDIVDILEISTHEDVNKITSPMSLEGQLPNSYPEDDFILLADISMVEANNPIAIPIMENKFMLGSGRTSGFVNAFNENKAKEEAINLWNSAVTGLDSKGSFVQTVRNILDKFEAIIKRKAFVERRVHRFINENKSIFLPEHKTCLYEHKLYLKGDRRIADFILEREPGLPSIFIELESPVHKVFTKKGDLTAESNHARQQVSEWVKYVENEPQTNAVGDYSFLTGTKERMVVIGRGLEDKDGLTDTKYDGVTFWTYSLMLEEAKNRMNQRLSSQYKLLGLDEVRPF